MTEDANNASTTGERKVVTEANRTNVMPTIDIALHPIRLIIIATTGA